MGTLVAPAEHQQDSKVPVQTLPRTWAVNISAHRVLRVRSVPLLIDACSYSEMVYHNDTPLFLSLSLSLYRCTGPPLKTILGGCAHKFVGNDWMGYCTCR